MEVGSSVTLPYFEKKSVEHARAAAHMLGSNKGWKFQTRIVDGLSLKVTRIA